MSLIERLRGSVIPAVVTPMAADGTVDYAALEAYAAALTSRPIGGVAVWAHTGRGLYLSEADRARVLTTWRRATGLPIVAGAGVPRASSARTLPDAVAATVATAVSAARLGADAIMVYPLAQLAAEPDGDAQAVRLHERVASETGLPLVGFYLHGEAGGYPYRPGLIRDLLALPSMLGVKMATLDRAIGCQDGIWAGRGSAKLAITGEDRMFGPSLMWGCDTALVGIAAAQVELSADVLRAWQAADHTAFVRASGRLDRFAAATFYAPIEGYVQRMMWAAELEGLIPAHAAHDAYGPPLPAGERDQIVDCLAALKPERYRR